jgi:hypothetical protein
LNLGHGYLRLGEIKAPVSISGLDPGRRKTGKTNGSLWYLRYIDDRQNPHSISKPSHDFFDCLRHATSLNLVAVDNAIDFNSKAVRSQHRAILGSCFIAASWAAHRRTALGAAVKR